MTVPRLTSLDLALNSSRTEVVDLDSLIQALTRHGPALTSLVLGGIALYPALLDTIANHCPNLHSLAMCTACLSSECIITLGNSLKHLNAQSNFHSARPTAA